METLKSITSFDEPKAFQTDCDGERMLLASCLRQIDVNSPFFIGRIADEILIQQCDFTLKDVHAVPYCVFDLSTLIKMLWQSEFNGYNLTAYRRNLPDDFGGVFVLFLAVNGNDPILSNELWASIG